MVAQELGRALAPTSQGRTAIDVRIGLGYTAVMLDDGSTGVAYTFREEARGGCSLFMGRRPISGTPARDLLKYLCSPDRIECAVGLATANALANRPSAERQEGDTLALLDLHTDDRVGMVGYFGPLVAPLQKQVRELLIFERDSTRSKHVLPGDEAFDLLPGCDVALITSTALILGDLNNLLEAARGCREVALVGASTPLAGDVFRTLGVTLLSGVTVTDGSGILQIVSEGGGMGFFGSRVRKVNVRVA